MMERIRRLFERQDEAASYEPLTGGSERPDGEHITADEQPFAWTDYSVFLLLGIAMLWAWNMFLAAAPYFQHRFAANDNLLRNFQSAILSVSTVGNLGSMIVLTNLQAHANYPKRIIASLTLYASVFTLLALSTKLFLDISPGLYFAFLMLLVLTASLATGLCQNGVFAYVSGFGREEYTQAIMTGQGIAGVLPAITQIITVLSVSPAKHPQDITTTTTTTTTTTPPQSSSTSACIYFLTATAVSTATLLAFSHQLSLPTSKSRARTHTPSTPRKQIPLLHLFSKLPHLALAITTTFTLTMFFPVFTVQIPSTHPLTPSTPRLLQPSAFIPLAFLAWNAGDLLGRTLPALPALRLAHRPRLVLALALARAAWIPLYTLCNVGGRGAVVNSDVFYLGVVQLGFGVSSGYLGSCCMMGFGEFVEQDELEAAGGFMSLCLVVGLAVGSLASFAVAGAV